MITGRISSEQAGDKLLAVWGGDKDRLAAGGFLSKEKVAEVLSDLEEQGVIDRKQHLALLEIAQAQRDQDSSTGETMWTRTVDALSAHRDREQNRELESGEEA